MIVGLPTSLAEEVVLPIPVDSEQLDTPAILVDLDIVDANIGRMAELATARGLALRPHAKTHKSPRFAKQQIETGAVGICVAKVSEAQVMVEQGITDITIAYPVVGTAKFSRLASFVNSARLTLVADSASVVEGYASLARHTGTKLPVLVEVDTGMHRVGINPSSAISLAKAVRSAPSLSFEGLLTHAGHAHNATDAEGVKSVAREEARILGSLREELEAAGLEVPVVTAGSTLTSWHLAASDGVTEIRPGTYIYNDLRTVACWSATIEQIAARALVTVVSVDRERVTVDAGNKTLTLTHEDAFGFGHVMGRPEMMLTRLSEEHGVMASPSYQASVGERLQVLPIHVCVWMDLQPEVYGVRGGRVVERIALPAMRHSL
jgi:D-serine deaminase-like pyridoxal phosphate-dependent protein